MDMGRKRKMTKRLVYTEYWFVFESLKETPVIAGPYKGEASKEGIASAMQAVSTDMTRMHRALGHIPEDAMFVYDAYPWHLVRPGQMCRRWGLPGELSRPTSAPDVEMPVLVCGELFDLAWFKDPAERYIDVE
jgi:hypothetical protein